ncbi:hypothetical protein SDC9_112848 [bioreactor metagenome]|uniref:Uncharacterized protein n=1 Tax=bioreactor metagenome TaxID=1076179 RepID=A0A645BVY7_9ZZZZ
MLTLTSETANRVFIDYKLVVIAVDALRGESCSEIVAETVAQHITHIALIEHRLIQYFSGITIACQA